MKKHVLVFASLTLATSAAFAWDRAQCDRWYLDYGVVHEDCRNFPLPVPTAVPPQLTSEVRQAMQARQTAVLNARQQVEVASANLNAVTANPSATSEARAAAQAQLDSANTNLNNVRAQGGAGGSATLTSTIGVTGGPQSITDAPNTAGGAQVATTNINKVITANPVTAHLSSLPALPQATADAQYVCEHRGRPYKVDRNVFFNGTRTEGPVKTGLDAFIWQYATKNGPDNKPLVDEFGDPRKYAYSRYHLPFGNHKLPEDLAFEGEMKERVTKNGIWVEVGHVVKYTYLTSAAAFNGSLALALSGESKQGSVAAASGGTISDRVVVEVKDTNQVCSLNADELRFIERKLILPLPTDVCPNIDGIQSSVPVGMTTDSAGNCIKPPPAAEPSLDLKKEPRVTGRVIYTGPHTPKDDGKCPVTQPDGSVKRVPKRTPQDICGSKLETAPTVVDGKGKGMKVDGK